MIIEKPQPYVYSKALQQMKENATAYAILGLWHEFDVRNMQAPPGEKVKWAKKSQLLDDILELYTVVEDEIIDGKRIFRFSSFNIPQDICKKIQAAWSKIDRRKRKEQNIRENIGSLLEDL